MSKWYPAKWEDIEVHPESGEVDILVCSDDDGNIYTTLSQEMVRKITEKIDDYWKRRRDS